MKVMLLLLQMVLNLELHDLEKNLKKLNEVLMLKMVMMMINLVWVNLKDLIGKIRIVVVRKRKVIKTKEIKFKFNYITNKIK